MTGRGREETKEDRGREGNRARSERATGGGGVERGTGEMECFQLMSGVSASRDL